MRGSSGKRRTRGGLPAVLEVENLSFDVAGVRILESVSFALAEGDLAVVMGGSGSGKTTLLKCLNRLSEPSGGRILLDGVDTREIPAVEVRRRIGMVPQVPFMFPGTVRDNLERAADYIGARIDEDGCAQVLHRAGLDAGLDREALTLSVGQQQRIAVARALIGRPRVLLFDEPTAALDHGASLHLERTLTQMSADGMAIVVVTHDRAQAERVADRLFMLDGGALSEVQGRPTQTAAGAEE